MKDQKRIKEEIEALKKCLQGNEESVFAKFGLPMVNNIETKIEVLEWVLDED